MAYQTFTSAGEIVHHVAATFGMELKLLEARLQREWAHVVGAPLAAHTQPGPIKFRKLTVTTENSVWLQQLVFLKAVLLERITAFAGRHAILDLTFRVGEISPAPSQPDAASKTKRPHQPRPSAPTLTAAASVTRMLHHDDLRRAMTELIAKALAASSPQ